MTAVQAELPAPPAPPPAWIKQGPPPPHRSRPDQVEDVNWDDEPPSRHRHDDDPEFDERPGVGQRKLRRRDIRAIRTGLRFYHIKLIAHATTMLAVMGLFMLTLMLSLGPHGPEWPGIPIILLLGLFLLAVYLVTPILGVIGVSFLVQVPPASGARGLAIVTLVFEIMPIGCGIILGAHSLLTPNSLGWPLICLSPLLLLPGFILFALFLKQFAYHYLKNPGTTRRALPSMIGYLFTTNSGPFLTWLIFLPLMCVGCFVAPIVLIGWPFLVIKQLLGILKMIATVRYYALNER